VRCIAHSHRQYSTEKASRVRGWHRLFLLDACEACGFAGSTINALTIHCLDGSYGNVDEANFQTLCRSCHGFWERVMRRATILQGKGMPDLHGISVQTNL
jgi:hypothetical protein